MELKGTNWIFSSSAPVGMIARVLMYEGLLKWFLWA